jgi:hypothetical protein
MKLKINRKKCEKYSNTWKLNKALLNDQWVVEKMMENLKILQLFLMKTQSANIFGPYIVKAVLTGKFIFRSI